MLYDTVKPHEFLGSHFRGVVTFQSCMSSESLVDEKIRLNEGGLNR